MIRKCPLSIVALCLVFACISSRREMRSNDSPEPDSETVIPDTERAARAAANIKTLARNRLGDRVRYIPNAANTHVLCVGESPETTGGIFKPAGDIRFFVYRIETESIVFEDTVNAASVSWEDDTHIQVTVTPGTVHTVEIEEYGYRYDVITGTKETLTP